MQVLLEYHLKPIRLTPIFQSLQYISATQNGGQHMEVYGCIQIWHHNAKGLLQGDVDYSAIKIVQLQSHYIISVSYVVVHGTPKGGGGGRDWLHTDEVPCRPVLLQATLWWSWHVVQESASTTPQDTHTSENIHMYLHTVRTAGYKAVTVSLESLLLFFAQLTHVLKLILSLSLWLWFYW